MAALPPDKRKIGFFKQPHDIMRATERMSYEEVLGDTLYNAGLVRFFEIIGEAAKHVPDDFRNKYPEIPWRKISGLHDRLIHDYPGVNLNYVWTLPVEKSVYGFHGSYCPYQAIRGVGETLLCTLPRAGIAASGGLRGVGKTPKIARNQIARHVFWYNRDRDEQ